MLKVMLVSMPYSVAAMPSIAIAQLAGVARQSLGDAVQVDSRHAFLDFAEFVGMDAYRMIGEHEGKGLNDWLFRQAAFPVKDNLDAYKPFFFSAGAFPRKVRLFDEMLAKRARLNEFLDMLIERDRLDRCDVVGFTSMMSQNVASFALARRIKQRNSRVITVMGGANCEHPMGQAIVRNVPDIDYVFSGEALVSFPSFLNAVAEGRFEQIELIRGVHAKPYVEMRQAVGGGGMRMIPLVDTRAAACHTDLESNSGQTYDLNTLPTLDYSEYVEKIEQTPALSAIKDHLILPFQTSTGCWWADKIACSFCGLTPHAFRQMNSEKATEYIRELIEKYEGQFSVFEATDPCMPVEYPHEVFNRVNKDKRVVLQYEVKARMSQEEMKAMADANVLLPQPGIESLSSKTLKLMRKGISGLENVLFLKNCAEYGMYPIWNFLYGLPNKEYDELRAETLVESLESLFHLPPPASAIHIAFQRYTEYFNEAAKYGLKLTPLDHYFHIYPFDESVVADLAYTFKDPSYVQSFYEKNITAVRALNMAVVSWMFRFREGIPRLQFVGDLEVFDSRTLPQKRFSISRREKDLLLFLGEPQSTATITKHFGWAADEVEEVLTSVKKHRLVFHDGGRFLNLVTHECRLTDEAFRRYYLNFVTQASAGFDKAGFSKK